MTLPVKAQPATRSLLINGDNFSFILAAGLAFFGCFTEAYEAALRSFSRSRIREIMADEKKDVDASRYLKDIVAGEASVQISAALLHAVTMGAFALYVAYGLIMPSLPQTLAAGNNPLWSFPVVWRLLVLLTVVSMLRALSTLIAAFDEEKFVIAAARPAWFLTTPLRPVAEVVLWMSRVFARGFGQETEKTEEDLEEEVMAAVSDGELDGVVEKDQREMIEGIFYLKEQDVADIFTPRTEMVSINVNAPVAKAIKLALEKGHSRLPVHEDTRDNIVGIFYVRDILEHWGKSAEVAPTLREAMRPPLFVPETKDVPALLRELRKSQTHIAIVLDEYGGTAGLVTIEDVLEEIVGEILDEFDENEEGNELTMPDENTVIAEGQTHVAEVNKSLGKDIIPEDGDYETLAGFVLDELGHIPKKGEEFSFASLQVKVLAADERKVERVQVRRDRDKEDE